MSRRLVYYNPQAATAEENRELPGIRRFADFFRIFNASVMFLDRSGTIKSPIRTTSLFPIPSIRPFKKKYEEICQERARELLARADSLGVRIYTMWSGGIDSTLLLISLLKEATDAQKKNITVLMSEESIAEYPGFYRDHIRGKLAIDSSAMFPRLIGGKDLLIGGEHNDQIFGSDLVGALIQKYGPAIIHAPYKRENFFEFFSGRIGDPVAANFYLDMFDRVRAAAPIEIRTHFEYLWWLNFSLKWQSVYMRMLSFTSKRSTEKVTKEYLKDHYVHFYGTEDFQLWSMLNLDKKIKDTWQTYKWTAKDVIYEYTRDADYRDNKLKRGSLSFLVLQQESYDFIDEDFRFYKALETDAYYEPDNDFI